ncbi:hypothetical protein WG68_07040 [Arsukibacterium ikkense]|uniref:Uncharacterized protein n=1 Tax=Arsukibacterium ikkense TaxID=336831 RepID=A0A0M2V654_9GAMM|nr:hypothetical protein [Arsukibacterium ikkense]KKO46106.1 hypothetical protein WG68_07040 [Arsukibacterium ikkense]
MTQVAYHIFYDFDEMLRGLPLHTRLSKSEEEENIKRLPFDLDTVLDDENAIVNISTSSKGKIYSSFGL